MVVKQAGLGSDVMKDSTRVGIVMCLAVLLAFSLSVAFAGNEKVNVTKNMTNVTNPFAHVKGMSYLNNTSLPSNEVQLGSNPNPPPPRPPPSGTGGGGKIAGSGGGTTHGG